MKEYFRKHKLSFLYVGVISVLSSAVFVGVSLVLQFAIDYAIAGEIKSAVLISVGFILVFAVMYWLQAWGLVMLNQKVIKEIRENIVRKVLYKTTEEFRKYKETDYISLVQNDVKKIEDSYLGTIFSIICSVTQLIFAIVVMTYYSWIFTVTMLAMTVIMFLVPVIFSKKLQAATKEVSEAQELLTEGLSEVVLGYEVTKTFQKEEYRISGFKKCNILMQRKAKKLEILRQANGGVSNVLAFSMQMVICILAGWFIFQGKMSYGSMVGVIQVSGSITNPLFQLFSWIPVIKSFKPIWEKIATYTQTDNYKYDTNVNEETDKHQICWNEISYKNVQFSYPNEEKQALTDINFTIRRGKKYLIIGESGGGKSTLINILCGNYLPQNGEVMVDGKRLGEDEHLLQKLFSVVWQNTFLFNESILDNILMGDNDDGKLDDVIKKSNLREVIAEKGTDFVVGSNGDLISGGQKQRIAIARALYADKDILVLDEGVSALDPAAAEAVEIGILSEDNRTVLAVSHHVTPKILKMYDEVLEIKDGRIMFVSV